MDSVKCVYNCSYTKNEKQFILLFVVPKFTCYLKFNNIVEWTQSKSTKLKKNTNIYIGFFKGFRLGQKMKILNSIA